MTTPVGQWIRRSLPFYVALAAMTAFGVYVAVGVWQMVHAPGPEPLAIPADDVAAAEWHLARCDAAIANHSTNQNKLASCSAAVAHYEATRLEREGASA